MELATLGLCSIIAMLHLRLCLKSDMQSFITSYALKTACKRLCCVMLLILFISLCDNLVNFS